VSSAARDPLRADELDPLYVSQLMVFEAAPDPAPGPERDALAAGGAARIDRAVALMEAAIAGYNERFEAVVEARLRGPKARKGTRFWSDRVISEKSRGVNGSVAHKSQVSADIELKALDASYVLPQRVVDELADVVRPVGLRIVADASAAVAKSLGRPNVGLAAFDWKTIHDAVDSTVQRMLEVNERHARDIRREILGADSTAESLDAAVARVLEATRRGGKWLLISGRTLATALAGDAALGAARALGVIHTQWLSRRDGRVRHTHVTADGQERPIGSKFTVGAFRLRFPADPEVLPAGASEVMNCRCSLLFAAPIPARKRAVGLVERGTPAAARRLLTDAALPDGARPMVLGASELRAGVSIPQVPVRSDVIGYRLLDEQSEATPLTPGQRISWPGVIALALAPPVAAGAAVLAVAIPVGAAVGVANGAVVLPAGSVLSVASVTSGQVVATPATVDA
jgi:hypothetical protein